MCSTLIFTEDLSQAAKEETGEIQVNLAEAVQKVREVVTAKYIDLVLPVDADLLFERCLRCRKFDIVSAAKLVHSFYNLLQNFCEIQHASSYLLPSFHQENLFEPLGLVPLRRRDKYGRAVVLLDIDRIPMDYFSMEKIMAAAILLATELTRTSVDIQRLGVVYVINLNGFQLKHTRHFTVKIVAMIAKAMQDSVPVRYKAFHFVRNPAIFSATYALLRHFLKEKIRNRIHFHGNNLASLHRHVSPDILPTFLGGDLPDEKFADVDFINQLCTMDKYYYSQFLQHGYMKKS